MNDKIAILVESKEISRKTVNLLAELYPTVYRLNGNSERKENCSLYYFVHDGEMYCKIHSGLPLGYAPVTYAKARAMVDNYLKSKETSSRYKKGMFVVFLEKNIENNNYDKYAIAEIDSIVGDSMKFTNGLYNSMISDLSDLIIPFDTKDEALAYAQSFLETKEDPKPVLTEWPTEGAITIDKLKGEQLDLILQYLADKHGKEKIGRRASGALAWGPGSHWYTRGTSNRKFYTYEQISEYIHTEALANEKLRELQRDPESDVVDFNVNNVKVGEWVFNEKTKCALLVMPNSDINGNQCSLGAVKQYHKIYKRYATSKEIYEAMPDELKGGANIPMSQSILVRKRNGLEYHVNPNISPVQKVSIESYNNNKIILPPKQSVPEKNIIFENRQLILPKKKESVKLPVFPGSKLITK